MGIKQITGKTQADGAQAIAFSQADGEHLKFCNHQIQITVFNASGMPTAPTAGTLTVTASSADQDEYSTIENGDIDLTSIDNWLQALPVNAISLLFTPTDLDADKTYTVTVTSTQ